MNEKFSIINQVGAVAFIIFGILVEYIPGYIYFLQHFMLF